MEANVRRIARKLYESVKVGDPLDDGWFEDALTAAMDNGVTLDRMIWESVRKIVAECENRESVTPSGGAREGNRLNYRL